MNLDIPKNLETPFINNGRTCDKCGATFQKLTFQCPFCRKVLINKNY